jgi:GT2 family glycosyltransferase
LESIAVILTSYNRVQKTFSCIQRIITSKLPDQYSIEIFLVDDHSSDNTEKLIKDNFPQVNVITGNGNLYWCGGMRMAWNRAYEKYDFDYYIWINDDVEIFDNSINQLLEIQQEYLLNKLKNCIVFGFCSSFTDNIITYGGINKKKFLTPNGKIQNAHLINGNFVLVPKQVFKVLGNLSDKYTHGMADYDYSLRANENNIDCVSTKHVVAKCDRNIDIFISKEYSFYKKVKILIFTLKNKNIKFKFDEYIYYRKRFFSENIFYIYTSYIIYYSLKIIISIFKK